jgi:hypothetical protein
VSIAERIDRKDRKIHEALSRECRATRHWMARQPSPPADWNPPTTSLWAVAKYVLHYQCQRCGTWRHIAIDHIGTMLAAKYDWPDWYLRTGEGRLTGEELRLWQAQQATKEARAARRAG